MKKFLILLFIFILFNLVYMRASFCADDGKDEIDVIVNENGPLKDISETGIREIYLGNKKFINQKVIVPIHFREGSEKDKFLASVIKMTSKEYRFFWIKKVFQEGGAAPNSQNSHLQIISSVLKNEAAIGYVKKSDLGGTKGIKVIFTIK